MSAPKAAKLPKGLPKLPPVPKGYHSWRLCGWGGLSRPENETPWGMADKGDGKKENYHWAASPEGSPIGIDRLFYIEAVKRASKPAPAAARKPAKPVKAALNWTHRDMVGTVTRRCSLAPDPVFVLPADAESVAQMASQITARIARFDTFCDKGHEPGRNELAEAILSEIGITAKGAK